MAAEPSTSYSRVLLPLAYAIPSAQRWHPLSADALQGPGMRWHVPAYGALQAKKGSNIQSGRSVWCKLQGGRRFVTNTCACAVRYGAIHSRRTRYETNGSYSDNMNRLISAEINGL